MREAKVKSYTRKTKSGKTITVRAHSRKCKGDSCESAGAGREFIRNITKKTHLKRPKHTPLSDVYPNEGKYAEMRKGISKDFTDFSALENYLTSKSSKSKKETSKKSTRRSERERSSSHKGPTKKVMKALKRRRARKANDTN